MAYLSYLILRGFTFFINLFPESFSLWLGRQMGRMFFHLDRGHQKVTLQNLHLAFGQEKSEGERRTIAKRTYQNLGMVAVEFFRIPRMDMKAFERKVSIEGFDHVRKALEGKKGILLLLSHFGNWELMGMISKLIGSPALVIAKPLKKNPWLDRFINEIRMAAGLEVIQPEQAVRPILRALSENRLVGILIDQRAKRSEGVWADFFGKKAPTTPGLALLALKTRTPVMPAFMVREDTARHRLIFQEPVELIRTGDIKKDIEMNTERFNQVLEKMVRQYPDHWFWVHRRWERKQAAHKKRHRERRETGKVI